MGVLIWCAQSVIVFKHIGAVGGGLCRGVRALAAETLHDRLIVCLRHACRRRQHADELRRRGLQLGKLPVELIYAPEIERERRETEQQRERARIRHGAQRQMEECERNAEQRRRQRKEQQHTAAAFQIISEQLHFSPTA